MDKVCAFSPLMGNRIDGRGICWSAAENCSEANANAASPLRVVLTGMNLLVRYENLRAEKNTIADSISDIDLIDIRIQRSVLDRECDEECGSLTVGTVSQS